MIQCAVITALIPPPDYYKKVCWKKEIFFFKKNPSNLFWFFHGVTVFVCDFFYRFPFFSSIFFHLETKESKQTYKEESLSSRLLFYYFNIFDIFKSSLNTGNSGVISMMCTSFSAKPFSILFIPSPPVLKIQLLSIPGSSYLKFFKMTGFVHREEH